MTNATGVIVAVSDPQEDKVHEVELCPHSDREARSKGFVRKVEIMSAAIAAGQAGLSAVQVEQLGELVIKQRTALCCAVRGKYTADVVPRQVIRVVEVVTSIDDGGNDNFHAGVLPTAGSERRDEGGYGHLDQGARGVAQESRPTAEVAATRAGGGKLAWISRRRRTTVKSINTSK